MQSNIFLEHLSICLQWKQWAALENMFSLVLYEALKWGSSKVSIDALLNTIIDTNAWAPKNDWPNLNTTCITSSGGINASLSIKITLLQRALEGITCQVEWHATMSLISGGVSTALWVWVWFSLWGRRHFEFGSCQHSHRIEQEPVPFFDNCFDVWNFYLWAFGAARKKILPNFMKIWAWIPVTTSFQSSDRWWTILQRRNCYKLWFLDLESW